MTSDQLIMTAEQLGVEQWELDAALRVREFLLQNEAVLTLPPEMHLDLQFPSVNKSMPMKFAMAYSVSTYECGTACCIGGWMALTQLRELPTPDEPVLIDLKIRDLMNDYVSSHDGGGLEALFYPDIRNSEWKYITPGVAAQAIWTWATTGEPRWEELLD